MLPTTIRPNVHLSEVLTGSTGSALGLHRPSTEQAQAQGADNVSKGKRDNPAVETPPTPTKSKQSSKSSSSFSSGSAQRAGPRKAASSSSSSSSSTSTSTSNSRPSLTTPPTNSAPLLSQSEASSQPIQPVDKDFHPHSHRESFNSLSVDPFFRNYQSPHLVSLTRELRSTTHADRSRDEHTTENDPQTADTSINIPVCMSEHVNYRWIVC
jgi:hypothetical protein